MRAAVAVALLVTGCGIRLDEPAPGASTTPAPAVAPACRLFDGAGVTRVSGRVGEIDLADGRKLFIAGSARVGGEDRANAGFIAEAGATGADCYASATLLDEPVLAPSPRPDGALIEAMAPLVAGDERWLFYRLSRYEASADFGVALVGYGVARWDDARLQFVPGSDLLWTADRPSFGSAAVVDGEQVYTYGCVDTYFSADCYVAVATVDHIDDPSGYVYSSGGTHFVTDVDQAWPLVAAANPVAVAPDAEPGRWLMAYTPVLGSTLVLRSGLSPTGPWSNEHPAASCALDEKDSFCSAAAIVGGPSTGKLAVTYAVSTFDGAAVERNPAAYWSRMASVSLPGDLP